MAKQDAKRTATVHMVLQGKGGVGKSVIASLLAQYKASKGATPVCVDTDPVNASFAGYEGIKVQRLDILDGDDVNPRKFDALVEIIHGTDADVIVDNGASTFIQLSRYLVTQDVPELLQSFGKRLVVHTVITGGQAAIDTIHGFDALAKQFPTEAEIVVWLNPFWGPIEVDGKRFEQTSAYERHRERIHAFVQLPTLKAETFGQDFAEMLQAKQTFDAALRSDALTIMARQRLKIVQQKIYDQLANVAVLQ